MGLKAGGLFNRIKQQTVKKALPPDHLLLHFTFYNIKESKKKNKKKKEKKTKRKKKQQKHI